MPQLPAGRAWHWQGRPLLPLPTLEKLTRIGSSLGKPTAPITFTRDGKYALASLAERKADGGALMVLDGATLKEIKRIPLDKPVGAYALP